MSPASRPADVNEVTPTEDPADGSSAGGTAPPGGLRRAFAYRWLWTMAAAAFALDQGTKAAVNARLPLGSYGPNGIPVIRGFFNIVHVGNTGAAWSMFSGRSTLLAVLAIATLVAIFIWRHELGLRRTIVQVFFGLLCGGTVGNLADRIIHQHVIDFLDFHFGTYIYPTFNVADACICIGVIGYILWSLRQPSRPSER
ncbi:MAG TPA: signal peptidase II [Candidatus Didemnitutus sp.]|nr:signal peptidase II [Candidatus Didemnitutus sp.]